MDSYQNFIYTRSYARWLPAEQRRESWHETVQRYFQALDKKLSVPLSVEAHVRAMDVMPSMRMLWTAGPALERDNIGGYNCAYVAITEFGDLSDMLYILTNGAGVGFSVERDYIKQLPPIPKVIKPASGRITVSDTKEGWAEALRILLDSVIHCEQDVQFNYDQIRPAGAPLKTFGGTASGPEPLRELIDFTRKTVMAAKGRQLNSIEVYDIATKIANCVVSGGVRRSATICLTNLSDQRMRRAKEGQFYLEHPHRSLSNNSVAYTERPDMASFMEEWYSLFSNGTGERGIVNREALGGSRRDNGHEYGVNPCGEIALRSRQFCNLTEVVVREDDSLGHIINKVRSATILGVIQSTFTDFGYIHPDWKRNCEEERLLGVSLTGVMDHPVLSHVSTEAETWLAAMKQEAVYVSRQWADKLGINRPTAVTCVKPSGTVSQLVGSASGLHPRYSRYYIRRVRISATDPLFKLMKAQGFPYKPEVGQSMQTANTYVFEFPIESPSHSVFKHQLPALQQLEFWAMYKRCWTEHNPSVTIYVKDHEWLEVGAWVYRNWDMIGGLSFLPDDGGHYQLAPYEEITREQYVEMAKSLVPLDFSLLSDYEDTDLTDGAQEAACSAGGCDL